MRPETRRASFVPILLAVSYLAVQIAVPLARVRPAHAFPFGARFTWSMFATPLVGVCSHAIEWRDRSGQLEAFPLPPEGHPARALLAARTTGEFRRVATLLGPYQDDDASLAHALDEILVRYRDSIDANHTHVLVSVLDCRSAESPAFHRVLRLEAAQ